MKIVSPFKDYYDVVLANDRDPYPFYLRQPAEYPAKERSKTWDQVRMPNQPPLPSAGTLYEYGSSYRMNMGCVAFCGRRYPYWVVGDTCCYTLAQITTALKKEIAVSDGNPAFLTSTKGMRKVLELLDNTKYAAPTKYNGFSILNKGSWDSWLQYMETNGRIGDEVFLREKTPVINISHDTVYINPSLRNLNFYTIMDPYTAYQEISMFLGNNLAQQVDPIPKTSDELKAHAHGYDKWSFRTHKEDSKKNKKRKDKGDVKNQEIVLDDGDFK